MMINYATEPLIDFFLSFCICSLLHSYTHTDTVGMQMTCLVATSLSLLFSPEAAARPGQAAARLQRFSDWPTEPPFRHGSHPPGETDSAS